MYGDGHGTLQIRLVLMGGEWVPKRMWWIVSPGLREGRKRKIKSVNGRLTPFFGKKRGISYVAVAID